jgi:transcriptional regulator with XRE-family HTH domain
MTFTEKLSRLTEQMNKSKVGRRAGLATSTIGSLLCTGSIPRADTALRIARVLRVSIEWLVDDEQGWPPVREEFADTAEAHAA